MKKFPINFPTQKRMITEEQIVTRNIIQLRKKLDCHSRQNIFSLTRRLIFFYRSIIIVDI